MLVLVQECSQFSLLSATLSLLLISIFLLRCRDIIYQNIVKLIDPLRPSFGKEEQQHHQMGEDCDSSVSSSRSKDKMRFVSDNPLYGYEGSPRGHIDSWRGRQVPQLGTDLVYLDYAGASLPTHDLLRGIMEAQASTVLSNPHSVGPSSSRTSRLIAESTALVLSRYSRRPHSKTLVYTKNASDALQTLASIFPFRSGGALVYAHNSHTSVIGTRVYAQSKGSTVLSAGVSELVHPSTYPKVNAPSLLIVPLECNFSGEISPIDRIVEAARFASPHWRILLDASKYLQTHSFDMDSSGADYVVGSFYKIFGAPTGLGFLMLSKMSCDILDLKAQYFGGGSVDAVLPSEYTFNPRRDDLQSALSFGTPNYQAIASLPHGFAEIDALGGFDAICAHTSSLAKELIHRLSLLSYPDGNPLVKVHSPQTTTSIVAFSVITPSGTPIGYSEVTNLADLHYPPIQIRAGCFCNSGACQTALSLSNDTVIANHEAGHTCGDSLDIVDGKATGAIRVSFGKESTWEDLDTFVGFLDGAYLSRNESVPHSSSFPIPTESPPILTSIYVYPIKSCAATRAASHPIHNRTGRLKYDREFCLIDAAGTAMRLSQYPKMAGIKCAFDLPQEKLIVRAPGMEELHINLAALFDPSCSTITVCKKKCPALVFDSADSRYSKWFTEYMSVTCYLARNIEANESFANEAPLLLLTRQAVDKLNTKLDKPVDPVHFRPNIVLNLPSAPQSNPEDSWKKLQVSPTTSFKVTGNCKRCQMVNVDPTSGDTDGSTLRALATYRREKSMIVFGVFVARDDAMDGSGSEGDNDHDKYQTVLTEGSTIHVVS